MSIITNQLQHVITALQDNQVAAIPTETVYGLAANANNSTAIQQVYALKHRPLNHPLIMHVAKQADLSRYARDIPDYVDTLIQHFWPGPLTLVLPSRVDQVNPLVTAAQNTIAIRSPKHPLTEQLLAAIDFPLVAPSANRFGKVSPTTAQHVQDSFKEEEFYILDGGRCPIGIESTIVLATDPNGYRILRHGFIDEHMLREVLPNLELQTAPQPSSIRISGNLKTHYQPIKPLFYFTDVDQAQMFCQQHPSIFVLSSHKNTAFSQQLGFQLSNEPQQLAYELYYQLRLADQSAAEIILIELPPDTAAWKGCRERIMKAGTDFCLKNPD